MARGETKAKKRKNSNDDDDTGYNTDQDENTINVSSISYDSNLSFSKIGGLDSIKETLICTVIANFVKKDNADATTSTRNGVMFWGAPGTGKTFMAMCVVAELNRYSKSNISLYTINGNQKSKYFGESEKIIKSTFERAKETAPSVIILDEIDSIGSSREASREESTASIVSQLLVEIQNLKSSKVLVIGITNLLHKVDPALVRSGRMDVKLQFLPPNEKGRLELLEKFTENWDAIKKPSQLLLKQLAKETNGLTGADIETLTANVVIRARSRLLGNNGFNDVGLVLKKLESQDFTITAEDWISESKKMKPKSMMSFGGCLFTPTPNITLCRNCNLSSSLFQDIEQELQLNLPDESTVLSGTILKPIIVWGAEHLITDINSNIVPTFLSKVMDRLVLYTINSQHFLTDEKSDAEVISDAVNQAINGDKPALVFLPSLDCLWSGLSTKQKTSLQIAIEKAQSVQVIVIATATSTPNFHCPIFQNTFGPKVSASVEVQGLSTKCLEVGFNEMFQLASSQLQKKCHKASLKLLFSRLVKVATKMNIKQILFLKADIEKQVRENSSEEKFLGVFKRMLEEFEHDHTSSNNRA